LTQNDAFIQERESEINDIIKSINELAIIFKDMNMMVIDQGTILDRIDFNIEQTGVNLKDAVNELQQGEKYQKQHRKKLVILILILAVFAIIIAIIIRSKLPRSSPSTPIPPPVATSTTSLPTSTAI
jgi:syntaxin 16